MDKKFADTYEGCQVVANLMGLNVETVRKRAKAGKIPGTQNARGIWVFNHVELALAGIHPFVLGALGTTMFVASDSPGVRGTSHSVGRGPTQPVNIPAAPIAKVPNRTEVIFVLDRSSSMHPFQNQVRDSLRGQIDELFKASGPNDIYNVSVINFDARVDVTMQGAVVRDLVSNTGAMYLPPSGMTALYDAIGKAVEIAKIRDDGKSAFLISILTDGEDNSSLLSHFTVSEHVKSLTASGRYTFTYAGPLSSVRVAQWLGIPAGNTTSWEQSTAGFEKLSTTHRSSLNSYTTTRGAGTMRSESFYATPVTADPAKFAVRLDGLKDVTGVVRVERVTKSDPTKISDFANAKFGSFEKGDLYYELNKSEKVQDYKGIIVQDTTKGRFFVGWQAAKQLLGLPDFNGTVNIRPGALGEFKVFVQSTSLNRKLVPGTAIIKLGV